MYSTKEPRWECPTVGGRKTFEVVGDVERGAKIWIGASGQPLSFDEAFFEKLLNRFRGLEVRIGSKFDDPCPGSLGAWIQTERGVKMNPAVYVAGLLVRLGYAEYSRRGYIRFRQERISGAALNRSEVAKRGKDWGKELLSRIDKLSDDEAEALVRLIDQGRAPDDPFKALEGNPNFRLPTVAPSERGEFEPIKLRGGPLSEELIRDRR